MTKYNIKAYTHVSNYKKKRHEENEDSYVIIKNKDRIIVAISDGHGDSACVMAAEGAKLACEAVKQVFGDVEKIDLGQIEDLFKNTIKLWAQKVYQHWIEYHDEVPLMLYHLYGATLMIIVITENGMVIGNLGDGICFCDGEIITEDSKDTVDSLCDIDVWEKIKYKFLVKKPEILLLTSDGGGKFDHEQISKMMGAAKELYSNYETRNYFDEVMEDLCEYMAREDDVTMIWLFSEGINND